MQFFRTKIENYERMLEQGKHSLAIAEMENYLQQGLQEESDSAQLMQAVHDFDATIKQSIEDLKAGDANHAREQLERLKQLLERIKTYAALVTKEEEELE